MPTKFHAEIWEKNFSKVVIFSNIIDSPKAVKLYRTLWGHNSSSFSKSGVSSLLITYLSINNMYSNFQPISSKIDGDFFRVTSREKFALPLMNCNSKTAEPNRLILASFEPATPQLQYNPKITSIAPIWRKLWSKTCWCSMKCVKAPINGPNSLLNDFLKNSSHKKSYFCL